MSGLIRILYIDDDEDDVAIFEQALSFVRKETEFFYYLSGVAALIALKKGDLLPDVIFLDLNMPRLNGFDVLRELKKGDLLRTIPVIIFSTAKTETNSLTALSLGASGFIRKPNTFRELCTVLTDFIDRFNR